MSESDGAKLTPKGRHLVDVEYSSPSDPFPFLKWGLMDSLFYQQLQNPQLLPKQLDFSETKPFRMSARAKPFLPHQTNKNQAKPATQTSQPVNHQTYQKMWKQFQSSSSSSSSDLICLQNHLTKWLTNTLPLIPQKMYGTVFRNVALLLQERSKSTDSASPSLPLLIGEYYKCALFYGRATAKHWLDYFHFLQTSQPATDDLSTTTAATIDCSKLLRLGIDYVKEYEQKTTLILSLIKYEECFGRLQSARDLLSLVKKWPLLKSWKIILEGASFELRCGNYEVGRQIFLFLRRSGSLHWYPPLYYESALLEVNLFFNKSGSLNLCWNRIEEGLYMCPQYGPLWQLTLKFVQRLLLTKWASSALFGDSFVNAKVKEEPTTLDERKMKVCVFFQGLHAKILNSRAKISPPELVNIIEIMEYIHEFALAQVSFEIRYKIVLASVNNFIIPFLLDFSSNSKSHDTNNKNIQQLVDTGKTWIQTVHNCYDDVANSTNKSLRWKIWLLQERLENLSFMCCSLNKIFYPPSSSSSLQNAEFELLSTNLNLKKKEDFLAQIWVETNRFQHISSRIADKRTGDISSCFLDDKLSSLKNQRTPASSQFNSSPIFILEKALIDISQGNFDCAFEYLLANCGLNCTGDIKSINKRLKLWVYLLILANGGFRNGNSIRKKALIFYPKSGEIWCQIGRYHMIPTSWKAFDLKKSLSCLWKAMLYTPQYGDSFIELYRHCIIQEIFIAKTYEITDNNEIRIKMNLHLTQIEELRQNIKQKCANARPQYGDMWLKCRQEKRVMHLTAEEILEIAHEKLMKEVEAIWCTYDTAISCYLKRMDENLVIYFDSFRVLFEHHFMDIEVVDEEEEAEKSELEIDILSKNFEEMGQLSKVELNEEDISQSKLFCFGLLESSRDFWMLDSSSFVAKDLKFYESDPILI